MRTLDTRGTAVGRMKYPCGVAVDSDDNILVVNSGNGGLLKFSRGGDLIAAVGSHGDGPGQFNYPRGVCVNSVNGKVYVADNFAHCVHIFNSDLTFSSKFGSKGCGNGQFSSPYMMLRPIVVDVCIWLMLVIIECKSSHLMVAI